ncbi:CopG family transcriptional regulator [Novosphingobium sp. B1]|uniref:ribbon-helix-helix domain-containing protein n=1 Tax=Novosphingobium sp. B1 TaxID=1938756 RepID=UPI0009FDAE5D
MLHSAAGRLTVTPSKNRLTVNLTDEEASQLARLAEKTKVSKAWLGRRAICSLLERAQTDGNQVPLPFASAVVGRGQ